MKSLSGSCISTTMLAAVLPRPTRAASSSATLTPASASRHASKAPVIPPPTIATSTRACPRSRRYDGASARERFASHNGTPNRSRGIRSHHWRPACFGSTREDFPRHPAVLDRVRQSRDAAADDQYVDRFILVVGGGITG